MLYLTWINPTVVILNERIMSPTDKAPIPKEHYKLVMCPTLMGTAPISKELYKPCPTRATLSADYRVRATANRASSEVHPTSDTEVYQADSTVCHTSAKQRDDRNIATDELPVAMDTAATNHMVLDTNK